MDSRRAAALDTIRRNISLHGHHVYVVQGASIPRFAYTIGLSRDLGSELILAGSIIYMKAEVVHIVNSIAAELRSRHILQNSSTFSLGRDGSFTLRSADPSWARMLMLGALDYYQVDEVPALQIVPDEAHRTIDVPDLGAPWSLQSSSAWRWLNEPWSFPVPEKSVAATNLAALRGERVTEAARWEEDEWEICAGPASEVPPEEMRVVPIGTLIAADESLGRALTLAVGDGIWREAGSDWRNWD